MTMRRLDKSMYGVVLASANIFLLAFLQISVICFSNTSLLSNLTPSRASKIRNLGARFCIHDRAPVYANAYLAVRLLQR